MRILIATLFFGFFSCQTKTSLPPTQITTRTPKSCSRLEKLESLCGPISDPHQLTDIETYTCLHKIPTNLLDAEETLCASEFKKELKTLLDAKDEEKKKRGLFLPPPPPLKTTADVFASLEDFIFVLDPETDLSKRYKIKSINENVVRRIDLNADKEEDYIVSVYSPPYKRKVLMSYVSYKDPNDSKIKWVHDPSFEEKVSFDDFNVVEDKNSNKKLLLIREKVETSRFKGRVLYTFSVSGVRFIRHPLRNFDLNNTEDAKKYFALFPEN